MENIILYDWVSITSKIHSVQDIKILLGMEHSPWVPGSGAKGFPFAEYYETIKIHFGRDDGYVWLEMPGQGCRAFETYGNGDFDSLFALVLNNPDDMKITRLDVAYDDKVGTICMDTLINDTRYDNFVSRATDWSITEGNKARIIYHGSKRSEVLIRIYDKAMERGYKDGRHWIRIEIQLRRDRAMQFVRDYRGIGEKFCGVLINYIRYVEPCEFDSNKWRWPIVDYWATLCETSARISLYDKPGTEYNIFNLTNFVFKQAGNAIDTALKILGREQFMAELDERGTRPNPKYEKLLEDSRRMKDVSLSAD